MPAWLVRRLAVSLLLVLVVATAVFFAVRLAPGDPWCRSPSPST